MTALDDSRWETMWATYDEETYTQALACIPCDAAVLDIGAGDLRLARRIAERARIVYAIEQRPELIAGASLPPNGVVIYGDARVLPFPAGVDTAVLLMRHCRHFPLYRAKLEAIGCERLITNARWGMGVECIDLTIPAQRYEQMEMGWYACRCGATGFRPGPPEQLSGFLLEYIHEVDQCPECSNYGRNSHRLA